MSNSTVLGVVLLTRHGDRLEFYQDPLTYTASSTTLTPLGSVQQFQLGSLVKSLYFNTSSPSYIQGANTSLVNLDQVAASADGSDEGGVIINSALSFLQGLFPANVNYSTTLANGTTVEGPLNGYQYIPLEAINAANDVSMEGYVDCNTFTNKTSAFYNSTAFAEKAQEAAPFFKALAPFVDNRPLVLTNMFNIFDYMEVNFVHNATFAKAIPPTFMNQSRALADWHEYGVFTDSSLGGVGNIAGRTVLPLIFNAFDSITSSDGDLKFQLLGMSYKPFLSLFNMTQAAEMHPNLAGIVNYAAALSLEIREADSGGEPVIRFNFKNGTDDPGFITYNILGKDGDIPMSTFVDALQSAQVNSTAQWCNVCNNTQDRGCGAITAAASQASIAAAVHQPIGPVGAGFLGAGLTLVVLFAAFGVLAFLGVLTIGKQKSRSTRSVSSGSSNGGKA